LNVREHRGREIRAAQRTQKQAGRQRERVRGEILDAMRSVAHLARGREMRPAALEQPNARRRVDSSAGTSKGGHAPVQ
jgi:hypothetical protein